MTSEMAMVSFIASIELIRNYCCIRVAGCRGRNGKMGRWTKKN